MNNSTSSFNSICTSERVPCHFIRIFTTQQHIFYTRTTFTPIRTLCSRRYCMDGIITTKELTVNQIEQKIIMVCRINAAVHIWRYVRNDKTEITTRENVDKYRECSVASPSDYCHTRTLTTDHLLFFVSVGFLRLISTFSRARERGHGTDFTTQTTERGYFATNWIKTE